MSTLYIRFFIVLPKYLPKNADPNPSAPQVPVPNPAGGFFFDYIWRRIPDAGKSNYPGDIKLNDAMRKRSKSQDDYDGLAGVCQEASQAFEVNWKKHPSFILGS